MKLVINIEDMGLHPAIRRAAEILAERGVVTSASLVASGMDTEAAVKVDHLSLGVHLDILRGRPMSHWQEVNTLVDENGTFMGDPAKLFGLYALGKVDHVQVEREWRAQIERILDYGVKPTHLTSYKHVHGWPSLSRMAAELAKKYGIEWVRKPEECAEIANLDKSGMQSKFGNICGFFDREVDDVNWTDCYWDAYDSNETLSVQGFAEFIHQCDCDNEDVVELCCSPGLTVVGDPPIPDFCNPPRISEVWRREFASLNEENWLRMFEDCQLELRGFHEL